MLNTGDILDSALSRQHDDSTELRVKALGWLNESMQLLYLAKDWTWLRKTDSALAVSSGAATLPSDFGRFVFCRGAEWYLKKNHQYTDEDVDIYEDDSAENPTGFTLDATSMTFHPAVSDSSVTLIYLQTLPKYADNQDTVVPDRFLPLLTRSVIAAVYEYENDQRGLISVQLEESILSKLKTDDNKNVPIPKRGKYL